MFSKSLNAVAWSILSGFVGHAISTALADTKFSKETHINHNTFETLVNRSTEYLPKERVLVVSNFAQKSC